ncbi:chaperonin [bacterium SM23_57]|jgi:chaperonin GroES|nr:MAG: chaperonin [bacterium SM23_57]
MSRKKLIVTGDRVLIQPDKSEERTKVGLYLPQTVKDKEEVIGGTVVQTGPGIPMVDPTDLSEEPWKRQHKEIKFLPVQAKPGDYALFLQKAGVEIKYRGEAYIIIPQSAILILLRDEDENFDIPEPDNTEY